MNGAIMIKQMLMAIVLMSLLVGNSLDAEASQRTIRQQQQQHQQKIADIQQSESKVREKRFINPFSGLFSVWSALTHIYSLYAEVSGWISVSIAFIIIKKNKHLNDMHIDCAGFYVVF